jgi:hypothetical protein
VGDLRELFQSHPSHFWFWREVLLAIIVTAFEEVRAHKLAAMGALLLGWVSIGVIFSYGEALDKSFTYVMVWSDWAILSAPDWLRTAVWRYRVLPVSYLGFTTAGFVIGLCQRRHPNAMLLMFVMTALLALAASAVALELRPGPLSAPVVFLMAPSSFHSRLGFIFIPLVILVGGSIGDRLRRHAVSFVTHRQHQ